ncbi:MAG: helix-turn-helix domain-containing protein [Actinomycetes bacterium]
MPARQSGPAVAPGDLGRRICRLRTQEGLTREELAARTGLEPGYLRYVEERPASVTIGTVTRIADALRTTVNDLLGSSPVGDVSPTSVAPAGVEILEREECMRLLRRSTLGRVAFQAQSRPMVLPVNFIVVRDALIVRTSESATLATSAPDSVAFEVDDVHPLDGSRHEAWSVVVQGTMRRVTGAELDRLEVLPLLEPWAPGLRRAYLSIEPERVTGRRFLIGPVVLDEEAP